MALTPEIDYFVMASESLCHIGRDTALYLRYVAPDAGAHINAYDTQPRAAFPRERHMSKLMDMGLWCEERFESWRLARPGLVAGPSRMAMEGFGAQLDNFVSETAVGLVNDGHAEVDGEALDRLSRSEDHVHAMGVLARTCGRMHADLDGYSHVRMAETQGLLAEMRALARHVDDQDVDPDAEWLDLPPAGRSARDRRLLDRKRRAVKRSVGLAERVIGTEGTRLFVSGEAIRVTGRLATYEITRQGSLSTAHGGASLRVLDRDTGEFLCNLCIYTPGVPVLDHVLSLVLHVQAGQEEEILRVGNAFRVSEAARSRPWLAPFLPARPRDTDGPVREIPISAMANLPPVYRGADREERLVVLRRGVAGIVLDALGDTCPPLPDMRQRLLAGLTERAWTATAPARGNATSALEVAPMPLLTASAR